MDSAAASGGDLASSLNNFTRNIKLPWAKFPGEMHLPEMNFVGPGTNLDKRLSTRMYKDCSKPVDRIDNPVHHDLAYDQFSDTTNRNIADRQMLEKIDATIGIQLCEREFNAD